MLVRMIRTNDGDAVMVVVWGKDDEPASGWLVVVVVGVGWRERTDDEPPRLVVVIVGVHWREWTDDEPR
jgi:hypothetical protein